MTQEATVTVVGSWVLIGIYTTPCCRAMFHLDAASEFIWKVEGLSVLLDSQGALCGLLALSAVSLLSGCSTVNSCFPLACSAGLYY